MTKEDAKYGAIIPLSFINSKVFSFKSEIALLFLIKDSVIVFLIFSEVFSSDLVMGSKTSFRSS